ncbi:glycosyltransferase [Anaeromyxobacter sp. PSR-1]|uniref:glycosyltransferase n=1 Tax=Anaeromyxobacter sp. PSR-1 TaxID=1300915 RepID=UPI0005EA3F9A|nr:glycosyltransferase [Anaeromyxobacter sp. PSR-1]GAO03857.1 glycogen synthase [Anaeromyxobacter sp. PSR-1]
MKILLHADAVGGVLTYALELAAALAARGAAVVLATEGGPVPEGARRRLRAVPGLVHEEAGFRLEWMDEPWDDVARAGEWLLGIERRERPDVVHLGAFAHGRLPFRAPRLVVGHSCVVSWYEAVRGEPPPSAWDRYRSAVREGLAAADAVAAPSAAMARALARHHGPLAPPAVIPNGRDPARFPPGEKAALVMGAGRLWDEAKGAAALARVAPRLPWPVAIAGEARAPGGTDAPPPGPATGDPTPRALPPGPAHLLGRLEEADLAAWLARAAVFAHPARYEPFGLAVLEAALAGCALVLADLESLRETWDGCAEWVPPRDDAALAAALRRLCGDPGRREALAVRARTRALRLGPGPMADAYLDLYRGLAARAGARP